MVALRSTVLVVPEIHNDSRSNRTELVHSQYKTAGTRTGICAHGIEAAFAILFYSNLTRHCTSTNGNNGINGTDGQ